LRPGSLAMGTHPSSQTEKARQPAQRMPPAAQIPQTPARDSPLPDATKSLQSGGPRDQAPGARSDCTQSQSDGGLGNPHSVRRDLLNPTSGPEPAPVRCDQIAPGAQGPGRGEIPERSSYSLGHSTSPDIRTRGPTARPPRTMNGQGLHFVTRYPTQSIARGPRSSPGSAPPGTRRESPSPH
jgi:hypothetical protein